MIDARWPSTMSIIRSSRLRDCWSLAPSNSSVAPGAIEWTASRSSASSPYHPRLPWCRPFAGAALRWTSTGTGSPWRAEYFLRSIFIVGAWKASITATVWPAPSMPDRDDLVHAVGALDLLRGVAAWGPRPVRSVGLGLVRRDLLAPVRRAGLAHAEAVGRRGVRRFQSHGNGLGLREADDALDDAGQRGRHRRRRGGRAHRAGTDSVIVQRGAERRLGLRYGSRREHQQVVGRHRRHVQAVSPQPGGDGVHVRRRRREARVELRGRQVPAVRRAARVGHRGRQRVEPRLITEAEDHGQVDALGAPRMADEPCAGRPRGPAHDGYRAGRERGRRERGGQQCHHRSADERPNEIGTSHSPSLVQLPPCRMKPAPNRSPGAANSIPPLRERYWPNDRIGGPGVSGTLLR